MNDLSGKTFGRLTVIQQVESVGLHLRWECACSCGQIKDVRGGHLVCGKIRSCGCLQNEVRIAVHTKHGFARKNQRRTEYKSWTQMLARCYNPAHIEYHRYGAKGVTVCEKWRSSFKSFISDMGEKPTQKHSIDRHPNNKGNYEPGNCRWATAKQQQRNRSNNRLITAFGKTLTLAEWNENAGFQAGVIGNRLQRGVPIERALTQPLRITSRTVVAS